LHNRKGSDVAATRNRAWDGLRGLAVAAVVCFHAQLAGARGGFLGVSAFFTLSGYLITSLLLDERARNGTNSLGGFWSRRARRLLPAAYLALAGVIVYGATVASGDQVRALRGDVYSALAYVANWHFYFAGRSYQQLFSAPSPVLHFWSLAIEEQFYLLFPLVLIGAVRFTRGRRAPLAVCMAAAAGASVVAGSLLVHSSGLSRVYYGTDTRAAELLVGALLAVVLHERAHWFDRINARPGAVVAATVVGVACLGMMVWWWTTVDQTDTWLYHGGFAAHAVLTAAVIAAARVNGPFARALGWRPLALLGIVSYGVYLFHWPIFLWLSEERTGLSTVPLLALRLAVTLAVAILSYHFIEQPVLRGRRVRGAQVRVVAPATAAVLIVALVAVTWSPPANEIVFASLGSSQSSNVGNVSPVAPAVAPLTPPPPPKPKIPVLYRQANGNRPLHILVVGDSVGLTLGRGFEEWAQQHGDAEVLNLAQMFCPLGRELPFLAGMVTTSPHACNWTDRWRFGVHWFVPDVTIVLFTIWEGAARRLPGSSNWSRPGNAVYDAWQQSEYNAAADELTELGGSVVWLNVPCEKSVKIDKTQGLWYIDTQRIPRTAATHPNVHPIDINAILCPRGEFQRDFGDVKNARPDGSHFSDDGALAVANVVMPMVLGQAPVTPYRTR
jgi:peptidoglycan/LPS O-acetylase OafA/YrhL